MGAESAGERYRGTPEARGERGSSGGDDQPTLQDYRKALALLAQVLADVPQEEMARQIPNDVAYRIADRFARMVRDRTTRFR